MGKKWSTRGRKGYFVGLPSQILGFSKKERGDDYEGRKGRERRTGLGPLRERGGGPH